MKKIGILLILAFSLITFSVDAQTKKKVTKKPNPISKSKSNSSSKSKKDTAPKDDKNFWKDEMMYGAFVNYPTIQKGYFGMELSPFIGYKPFPFMAIGVTSKFNYNWIRNPYATKAPLQPIDLGIGAFTRLKFLKALFLHGEIIRTKYSGFEDTGSAINIVKIPETAGNVGIGYSSGGKLKTEFGIYYNLLNKSATFSQNAFDLRGGITYNF